VSNESRYSYYVENKALEVADRPRKFLEAFAAVLDHSNYGVALDTYTRLSAKCARCTSSCQLYETTGADEDIPCHRSELLLRIYRRYFTHAGVMKARLFGGFALTDAYLDEMGEAYYRCTACRRCKATCPIGIDHGLVTHLARWLLAEIDVIPKALLVAVREQLDGVGNTSAISVPGLKDTCEFLEEELQDEWNVDAKFPIDVENAEYVFFPAVSDYLLEPETLMGNAAVMHMTGGSWTIGTGNFDGIDYGLFYSDRMMERIVNNVAAEVKRLKGKKVLVGECGHATRSAWYLPTFAGTEAPPVVHCVQYAYQMLLEGKLPLKDEKIQERVTYHDPCNIARAGRITEEPRELLKAICADYVEMTPNRTENYCCGGGGGTVSIDEIRAFRVGLMGKRKADQIRATGAKYVVAPCANCKKQLREICEDHDLEDVEVVGLHDLLLKVIDFSKAPAAASGMTTEDAEIDVAKTPAPSGLNGEDTAERGAEETAESESEHAST
jgi:Fe-S oxidoreductase